MSPSDSDEVDKPTEPKTTWALEDQSEEDEFMQNAHEVAEALVAMKGRRQDSDDRGHTVSHTKLENYAKFIKNLQPQSHNTQQRGSTSQIQQTTGTESERKVYFRLIQP